MANGELIDKSVDNTIVGAIQDGIARCDAVCEAPLMKRKEILEEYANGWYGSTKNENYRCPINMISRAINILLPLLVNKDPKAMTSARVAQLMPYADTLRLTINHLIKKIKLGQTLRIGTLDALTYAGIFKTGIAPGGDGIKDAFGVTHDAGQIFCDVIYPEDYFFDTSARRKEECDFEGNWFYVPVDYVLNSGLYDNYDKISESYIKWAKASPKEISDGGGNAFLNTFKPYVKLAEVYIPSENILLTIPEKGKGDKPLRVVDFNGPVDGPFDIMSLSTFPESVIPIAPLYEGLDLHYYINIMARKMAREAEAAKTVFPYEGNAADDVTNILGAKHMQTIKVNNINAFTTLKLGEIDPSQYQWIAFLKGLWGEAPVNMPVVGGMKSAAPTLGQEQMLMTNASANLDDMIQAAHNCTKSILHKMAYYIFTDPLMDITVSKRIQGLGEIPVSVTADTREGDFWDYNFEVVPYSLSRQNPQMRMQKLMQVVTGLILPTMEIARQQGVVVDVPRLVKEVTRDMDLTDGEIDLIYQNVVTMNTDLGPYQPLKGQVSGIGDRQGASPASRQENLNQQQNRSAGQSSPANTEAGKNVRE